MEDNAFRRCTVGNEAAPQFHLRWPLRSAAWTVRMKLEIPPGEFAGYIFDLDGTLVDTMPLHYRAWDAAMRHVGLNAPLDEELF